MTKRVLISPRVCTDRCLQSRAVTAALLPHCPATGEHTPPPKDLLGQCDPGPLASLLGLLAPHMPCPAHCCGGAELDQSLQKQQDWFLALASLSGGISDRPHLQRTIPNSRADPAPGWCPEQPSALPAAGLCSFAWLVLPFPLPCCTTMEWDMSAQRPVTCKQHLPVLKQEVQKIHLIALNI